MNLYNKILLMLKHEKDEITSSDFNVIPVYFYNTIGQLIKDGFVEAINNKEDKRKKIYRLTEVGKKEVQRIRGFFL